MKSLRRGFGLIFAMIAAIIFTGCSVKLTTVRPAEISELRVERISDGVIVSLPLKAGDTDIKERLIFQLEEPYNETGACAETDEHLYDVSLFIMDKLDTHLIINSDGSVCRNGKRYVPSEKADSPVDVRDWDELFADLIPASPFEAGEMDIVVAQGEPKPFPAGSEIQQTVHVGDILPWSYYISDVSFDGQVFIMVWRDTPNGNNAEWLCSIAQTSGDDAKRHKIEYIEGSYERSGKKVLYFTITNAEDSQRTLWGFDPETLYFNHVPDVTHPEYINL